MGELLYHFENLAKHDVESYEVDEALADRYRIFEKTEPGVYVVIGKTEAGRILELVYRLFSDGNRFVFHAMTARERYRKRYQKRRS